MGINSLDRDDAPSKHETPRILFAVFQTSNLANGGVESISQVIDGIDSDSVVVTQSTTGANDRWLASGKRVVVFELPYQVGEGFGQSGLVAKLRRLWSIVWTNWKTILLIRRHRLQLLHCNDLGPFWHVVLGARLLGTPIVLNLRDTKGAHEADNSASYRRRFRLIDALLVLSEEMAHFYRQMAARARFQIDRIRWKSIYSIVDFNRMKRLEPMDRSRLRVSLGMPAERLALGVVAAFNNKKNQLEFIEKACDLICRRLPQAHIYFVGDFRPDSDPYARQCQQAIDSLAVRAQITTTGFCPQVEKWYQSLDLIIIPTRKEGLARCMIEGLACGTPIVSFDVCSAKEILTRHDCGVVVSQGNYADLVDATVRLAENPGERKRLGDNGFAIARRLFHREEVIRQYKLLYRELQE